MNNQTTNSLKSVEDILKMGYTLYIPSYQRGYRWTQDEVKQLLDDLAGQKDGEAYFLQLLAVREEEDEENKRLRIIDGQQRLTTCRLILKCCGVSVLPELKYESRKTENKIDSRFRKEAEAAINDWLDEKKADGETEVRDRLKKRVLGAVFLYFPIEDSKHELDFFSRLNTWKIKATDSELVKCLFLSDDKESTIRERAMKWNQIERWLADDDVWGFVASREGDNDDRIGQMLSYTGVLGDSEEVLGNGRISQFKFYSAFKTWMEIGMCKDDLWSKIVGTYDLLKSWYADQYDRHLVGWYLHRKGCKISAKDTGSVLKTSAFCAAKKLAEEGTVWLKDSDLYYNEKSRARLHQYLLLANVAWCCEQGGVDYDFWRHMHIQEWSLEHVHARNQKPLSEVEFKELTFKKGDKDELWTSYSRIEDKDRAQKFLADNLTEDCGYPDEDEDNSLGNLALLPKDANSSLNDKLFIGKQREILSWALSGRGSVYWAPPLTVAMFAKEVGWKGDKFKRFWSVNDRSEIVEVMKSSIKAFLGHFELEG